MSTVVIGLGNPLRGDDAIGPKVAALLTERIAASGPSDVVVKEAHVGGLRLMDLLEGHDRAIIIDAMKTPNGTPGTVRVFDGSEVFRTLNSHCTHDGSLAVALALGREVGLHLPASIRVVGVEADSIATFDEDLTPALQAVLPCVVSRVLGLLAEAPAREVAA